MSQFTFVDPETGQEFIVKGPGGLTESQAAEIFAQQKDKGSLVGLKPGDILSAAKQAAAGLGSAIAQVQQAAAGIAGGVSGALGGAINQAQSLATGLTSATSLSTGLAGAVGSAKSLADKTLSGIASATKGLAVPNGIDVANFAKQATALVPIKGLSVPDVTATLAQASKLVGQGAGTLSNAGAGKYGLDCKQLELAGVVKPGTAAKYLASGVNDLTSVLKSPTVWTGKDGISSVDSLLSSVPSQDKIQQTLMTTGLSSVQSLGIPINSLDPNKLAGTALNAAKSAKDTLAWAAGSASTAVKSAFDTVARGAEFAVDFAKDKIDSAMSGEAIPIPASNTVDRKTLNAAVTRIVGNKKIPSVSFEEPIPSASGLLDSASGLLSQAQSALGSAVSGATSALAQAQAAAGSAVAGVTSAVSSAASSVTSLAGSALTSAQSAVRSASSTVDLAAQRTAIQDLETKQKIYEVAKAEYGSSGLQTQQAFAEYKAALAYLDTIG
jgi:hypothetical protein